ncbi:MAG: tyrosine--tRNA ligase [Gemmatimonadetes bacterium]|nr:tyrosine--tRNA ligase [Gemmatimonadota bacterium]
MSTLYDELSSRGFIQDSTPGLADRLAEGPITGYVGFDPTSDSLHVGNLVPIMGLAWLQRTGGTPIVLVGGGTGLVGDPSGKREERPVLPAEQAQQNAAAIREQLLHFLDFEGPRPARMVDNTDWLADMRLLDFLRDTGKHFTLNYMMQKESVRSRMEAGISFTEFSYMLVQAYDFLHLFRTERCELQMGGSDQWGNITAGMELIGREERAKAHGMVFPLLTTASGTKFGKSERGNIWLDPAKTSPYQFYQFWLNTDDRDVERFLKFFTFRSLDAIAQLVGEHETDRAQRVAQRELARDLTARVHGDATAGGVIEASRILFGGGDIRAADQDVFHVLAGEVPVARITREEYAAGISLVDALTRTSLASSKGDARRGLLGKGFAVNGEKADEVNRVLGESDLLADHWVLLKKGKKHYALLEVGG